jgi:UDP-N-acetylmuramate dehydrogenase
MRKEENYDLRSQNTFGMKVKCACYVEYGSAAELERMDWDSLPKPIKHIGEGSNLLFSGDFPGTVLHSDIEYIKYVDVGFDEVPVMVGAGVHWDNFVEETCRHGLWGAENLSLIPGETGAAAVQNIGAYGVEVKDIISGVVCYDMQERKKVKFTVAECGYGYRESMFKHAEGRYIVTSVLFRLTRKKSPKLEYKGLEALAAEEDITPMKVRDAIIRIRREKLPDPEETGSAGSFFKNPVVNALKFADVIDMARRDFGDDVVVPHYILSDGTVKIPAAWLIDRCGFKGAREGGAAVYEKQPLVIVNASGDASPADVLALEKRIVDTVQERFGITLSPEVEHL